MAKSFHRSGHHTCWLNSSNLSAAASASPFAARVSLAGPSVLTPRPPADTLLPHTWYVERAEGGQRNDGSSPGNARRSRPADARVGVTARLRCVPVDPATD